MTISLTISQTTMRRFLMGRQGLWPGRRWAGKAGTIEAIHACEAIQIDPLNVIARSHDIALYGRIANYQPQYLMSVVYENRQFFDYGGALFFYPMREMPYWRVVMRRLWQEPYIEGFIAQHPEVVAEVRQALRERGPLGNRHFEGNARVQSYRARKDTGLALYRLWLGGELMTHHRHNFQRMYHFRETVVPSELDYEASEAEAERHFARKSFAFVGLIRANGFVSTWKGWIERKVERAEAKQLLAEWEEAGEITAVSVTGDKDLRYVLSTDVPLLETLENGRIPAEWKPLDTTTEEEVNFLAPLEIVSARGRAKKVFDFDYVWEVYKPAEQRRWGYYTLPILYGDRLVARFDPKLDRKTDTLIINGMWLEEWFTPDADFVAALAKGLQRFMGFVGAKTVDTTTITSAKLKSELETQLTQTNK